MKDFSTKKAVRIIDSASESLRKLANEWDECDTVNGNENTVSEASDPMCIVMHVKGLLDIAAGMLEDCTQ